MLNLKLIIRILVILAFVVTYELKTAYSENIGDRFQVAWVIDGDTIVVKKNLKEIKVRFIGIDSPELHGNEKAQRDSKKSGVDIATIASLGKKSREHLNEILPIGSWVRLDEDVAKYDKYGRKLAYVYLTSGTFVNLKMVEDGYAYPYRVPPNLIFENKFSEAARIARRFKLGLWAQ